MSDESNKSLIQSLRETVKRLHELTEAIAESILRLEQQPQQPISKPNKPPSLQKFQSKSSDRWGTTTYGEIPPLSPLIRDLRNRHDPPRPQHQSTAAPLVQNNAYDTMLQGISPIQGNSQNNQNLIQSTTTGTGYCPAKSYFDRSKQLSSSGTSRKYPTSSDNSTSAAGFQCECHIGLESSSDEGCCCSTSFQSSLPQAHFKIDPVQSSTASSSKRSQTFTSRPMSSTNNTDNTGDSTPLSYRDHSELIKALIDWWRSFLLQSLMHEGTEVDILAENQYLNSLEEIVSNWQQLSKGPTPNSRSK